LREAWHRAHGSGGNGWWHEVARAYETPGGTLLVTATGLERLTVDRETRTSAGAFGALCVNSFTTACGFRRCRGAGRFFNVAQQRVTGSVGLKLVEGHAERHQRLSPYSLYRADLASFTMAATTPKTPKVSSTFLPCRSPCDASESRSSKS